VQVRDWTAEFGTQDLYACKKRTYLSALDTCEKEPVTKTLCPSVSDEQLAQRGAIQSSGLTGIVIEDLGEFFERAPIEWRVPFDVDDLVEEAPDRARQEIKAGELTHPTPILFPRNGLEALEHTCFKVA
jgi:hypothetical protein